MKTYRRKVIEVEAEQYHGLGDLRDIVTKYPHADTNSICFICKCLMGQHAIIDQEELQHYELLCPGDFVFRKDPTANWHAQQDYIFTDDFELVEG